MTNDSPAARHEMTPSVVSPSVRPSDKPSDDLIWIFASQNRSAVMRCDVIISPPVNRVWHALSSRRPLQLLAFASVCLSSSSSLHSIALHCSDGLIDEQLASLLVDLSTSRQTQWQMNRRETRASKAPSRWRRSSATDIGVVVVVVVQLCRRSQWNLQESRLLDGFITHTNRTRQSHRLLPIRRY